jgi:hypothetical protein
LINHLPSFMDGLPLDSFPMGHRCLTASPPHKTLSLP